LTKLACNEKIITITKWPSFLTKLAVAQKMKKSFQAKLAVAQKMKKLFQELNDKLRSLR
jgi:hypothetical protein